MCRKGRGHWTQVGLGTQVGLAVTAETMRIHGV